MDMLWSYHTSYAHNVCTIALAGEIDEAAYAELTEVLVREADRPGTTSLEVDLFFATFIDSTGIRALLIGYNAALTSGRRLHLLAPQGHVRKTLEICGLLPLLAPTVEHQPAAVRSLR